ncbi:GatB/YqeY domain-containing protein [Anaerophaga thermohalophila]|uniref:GatB/YqeY domain-containing protein n=1 Tax=Anaerophaga thermohalophila TaxID=177400 RepID=UPI00030AFBC8|nr:GatB/YqeY domain-containing protein [Anaerophaga thermohalophila]
MSLIDKVTEEIKSAMKAREQVKLEALRSIKKELLEARTAAKSGGIVSEAEELKILTKND